MAAQNKERVVWPIMAKVRFSYDALETTLTKRTGESHIATTPVGQLLTAMDVTTQE